MRLHTQVSFGNWKCHSLGWGRGKEISGWGQRLGVRRQPRNHPHGDISGQLDRWTGAQERASAAGLGVAALLAPKLHPIHLFGERTRDGEVKDSSKSLSSLEG